MSPTALFGPGYTEYATVAAGGGVGGVYPGWWGWRVGWGGLYRYPARPSPGPIFSIFKAERPSYGQMKANYEVSMRFLR